jgi:hypothetical protein
VVVTFCESKKRDRLLEQIKATIEVARFGAG